MNRPLHLLTALIILLLSHSASGQHTLGITKAELADTAYAATADTFRIFVKNTGLTLCNAGLDLRMSVNGGAESIIYSDSILLPPNAIEIISLPAFNFSNPPFLPGTNIVVVWPTGNGITASDSLAFSLFLIDNTGLRRVADKPSYAGLVYPNPSGGEVFVDDKIDIEHVRLFDLAGRFRIVKCYNRQLDLSGVAPGLYVVQIRDRNGNNHNSRLLLVE